MALGVSSLGAALLPGAAGAESGPSLVDSVLAAMQPRGTIVAQQPVAAPRQMTSAPPPSPLGPLVGKRHPFLNAESRDLLTEARARG